jgi:hypothetical protein
MENTAAHAVSLTSNLAHQVDQASELRNLSYSVIIADGIRNLKINEHIALTMFYRSLQTHEAIEILLRRELVEDAEALVRVLVENEVNCAYMLVVGDEETVQDFIRYPRFKNYVLMQGLKAVDETRFRKQVSVKLEDETRREHDALLPRYKDRRGEWCADGKLLARAAKIDERLAAVKAPYIEFRWLVNSSWRFNSAHVHGNADALLEQVSRSGNEIIIEQKFDAEDAAEALYIANLSVALLLRFIDGLLGAKNVDVVNARLSAFNNG